MAQKKKEVCSHGCLLVFGQTIAATFFGEHKVPIYSHGDISAMPGADLFFRSYLQQERRNARAAYVCENIYTVGRG